MIHYLLPPFLLALWIGKFVVWNIPNNKLNEVGLGRLVGFEECITFMIGGAVAVYVNKSKSSYNSSTLFWSTQLLSAGLFILPIVFIFMGLVGVIFYGLSV